MNCLKDQEIRLDRVCLFTAAVLTLCLLYVEIMTMPSDFESPVNPKEGWVYFKVNDDLCINACKAKYREDFQLTEELPSMAENCELQYRNYCHITDAANPLTKFKIAGKFGLTDQSGEEL